jgi:hypothetical protein
MLLLLRRRPGLGGRCGLDEWLNRLGMLLLSGLRLGRGGEGGFFLCDDAVCTTGAMVVGLEGRLAHRPVAALSGLSDRSPRLFELLRRREDVADGVLDALRELNDGDDDDEEKYLPARAGVAIVGVFALNRVVDAVERHPLRRRPKDRTADNRGERVPWLRVAVGEASQVVRAPGVARMHLARR